MKRLLFLFPFLYSLILLAQPEYENERRFTLPVNRAKGKIVIDGKLDEPEWAGAMRATPFKQTFPFDSSLAEMQTVARVLFDEQYLYISAVCYQPGKFTVYSLKRDYPNASSDIFFVLIDPFRDKLNGFYFSVTPYGVQKEGLIFTSSSGVENNFDWDNKWFCQARRYEDRFEVEMAIPFKTLRYKLNTEGRNEWNINFCRYNHSFNERSSWAPIPRNFKLLDLNFSGRLIWTDPPPSPGKNFSLAPFGLVMKEKDFEGNTGTVNDVAAGFDAKIGVTPSLNLDLTVNPDFAQVEVDQQVTNLSRFELFFPERRQFFLENRDLFGSFGFEKINPFFSRRIGIGNNVNTGEDVRVPIIAGARLSGRINRDWRIGLMNMQTNKSEKFSLPATNFTVAALQRRIGVRNNLGMIFVNKNELHSKLSSTRYNRILGFDYNLASRTGDLIGKLFLHRSFTPETRHGQYAMGGNIQYNSTRLNGEFQVENVGINYSADVGFIPRNGYYRNNGEVNFVFFPKGKLNRLVNRWEFGPNYDMYYGKQDKRLTDWDAGLFFDVRFQNGAQLRGALLRWDHIYLFEPFDPTNSNCIELPAGSEYTYFDPFVNFSSNPRKNFFYEFRVRAGGYFNGKYGQYQSAWSYRMKTFGILSIVANYTKINLPAPYCDADLWLIGPRAELSFSNKVFLNTFLQYNNQANNFNINARFQWRFRPVSDFFIVYTDNYFASDDPVSMINGRPVTAFMPKNRAIVAKLTYWFNL